MPETAGDAYADLIKDLVTEQRDRKKSLEQRGFAVITSSGTIVTILFALAALVSGAEDFELDGVQSLLLAGAVVLFTAAAIQGIRVNTPTSDYIEPENDWLTKILKPEFWNHEEAELGERISAEARVQIITSYRAVLEDRANVLKVGMWCEVGGIALVAITVGSILFS